MRRPRPPQPPGQLRNPKGWGGAGRGGPGRSGQFLPGPRQVPELGGYAPPLPPAAGRRWCSRSAGPDMLPDCLSAEGERRCRRLLAEATARFRARPAAAAVLVPLCSVRGVPALLYTLRSSRLAGRHKGDVRYTARELLFLLVGGRRTPETAGTVAEALSLSEPRFASVEWVCGEPVGPGAASARSKRVHITVCLRHLSPSCDPLSKKAGPRPLPVTTGRLGPRALEALGAGLPGFPPWPHLRRKLGTP